MDENQRKFDLLKGYFSKRDDVLMAFVFGSRAQNRQHVHSDWDLAVYFKAENRTVEWEEFGRRYDEEENIWDDCIQILGTDAVDLLVLNRAPVHIVDAAICGVPLVIKDAPLYISLMLIVTSEAEDYRQFANDYYTIVQRSASLSSPDRIRLQKTIIFLEEQMTLYPYFVNLTFKEYQDNIHIRNEVERWIENSVNAVIDISKIVLACQKKNIPDTYRDAVIQVSEFFRLPEAYIKKITTWVKLRNILAHEYLDTRWNRIEDFIKNSETYYKSFISSVKTFIC